jgi:hypothetical protein
MNRKIEYSKTERIFEYRLNFKEFRYVDNIDFFLGS